MKEARPGSASPSTQGASRSAGIYALGFRRLTHNRLAVAGMALIIIFAVAAVFAPLLSPYNPVKQNYDAISEGPSAHHWLGTDQLGRDAFSRLLHGARTSLTVGFFTQFIILGIGVPIGILAGYLGGRIDNLLMRGVDIVYAFPDLLFIILLRSVLGGGIFMIFLAIGLVAWTNVARLTRGQVLSVRQEDYVTAAVALGGATPWIMVRHVLPNIVGPLLVLVTFAVPRAIFVEATLSYIGIGVPPPAPSWGTMIQDGYTLIFVAPNLVLFPAIAIGTVMLAFTFLGDGLRDALDPRISRGRA
ncbi:MAG: ABC transporter permease [Chloroflexi bacterium]|nr:ABC transporter permease [Chloroflexota bacterium]